jgi:hypothetical protein
VFSSISKKKAVIECLTLENLVITYGNLFVVYSPQIPVKQLFSQGKYSCAVLGTTAKRWQDWSKSGKVCGRRILSALYTTFYSFWLEL